MGERLEHFGTPCRLPEPQIKRRKCPCGKMVEFETVITYEECDECGYGGCQHEVKFYDNNVSDKQVLLCEECAKKWREDGHIN